MDTGHPIAIQGPFRAISCFSVFLCVFVCFGVMCSLVLINLCRSSKQQNVYLPASIFQFHLIVSLKAPFLTPVSQPPGGHMVIIAYLYGSEKAREASLNCVY